MAARPFTDIDLGYDFERRTRPGAPGGNRLTISVYGEPTRRHFDPQRVCLTVATLSGVDDLHIHHPWHGRDAYPLVAGRIRMADRNQKCVAAFSYGGHLEIVEGADHTHLVITSPAPVLDLTVPDRTTIPALLAAETEVLIAQRRARWSCQYGGHDFDARLAHVDPAAFYAACIAALVERFDAMPCCDPLDAPFVRFLCAEQRTLSGEAGPLDPHLIDRLLLDEDPPTR